MSQSIFGRREKKFLITKEKQKLLLNRISSIIEQDHFGSYTISNIYYDTDQYDLIRMSIEKPKYKEKLRLRGYGVVNRDASVYVELKREYRGIVYKRQVVMPYEKALKFLKTGEAEADSQIIREIQYFLQQHQVSEKVFLSYDRTALKNIYGSDIRITFDENIRFRRNPLKLDSGEWGTSIINQNEILMEVKLLDAMPIWLSQELSRLEIFPSSFSKYGTCYKEYIAQDIRMEWEAIVSA